MTFIDPKATVEYKIDEQNTIWLKAKMDLRTKSAVQRDLLQMRVSDGSSDMAVHFSQMGQWLAVLKHNIVRWHGPRFVDEDGKRVPCKAENIDRLDPDANADWLEAVVDKIDELNTPATVESADPN